VYGLPELGRRRRKRRKVKGITSRDRCHRQKGPRRFPLLHYLLSHPQITNSQYPAFFHPQYRGPNKLPLQTRRQMSSVTEKAYPKLAAHLYPNKQFAQDIKEPSTQPRRLAYCATNQRGSLELLLTISTPTIPPCTIHGCFFHRMGRLKDPAIAS